MLQYPLGGISILKAVKTETEKWSSVIQWNVHGCILRMCMHEDGIFKVASKQYQSINSMAINILQVQAVGTYKLLNHQKSILQYPLRLRPF